MHGKTFTKIPVESTGTLLQISLDSRWLIVATTQSMNVCKLSGLDATPLEFPRLGRLQKSLKFLPPGRANSSLPLSLFPLSSPTAPARLLFSMRMRVYC